jgi:hypothetical protein
LAQEGDMWRTLLKAVMNLGVPQTSSIVSLVENCCQRKRFQVKINVTTELNAVPLEAFVVFRNF